MCPLDTNYDRFTKVCASCVQLYKNSDIRDEPLITVGGCRVRIFYLLFFSSAKRHLHFFFSEIGVLCFFSSGQLRFLFFSRFCPPPMMINGSSLAAFFKRLVYTQLESDHSQRYSLLDVTFLQTLSLFGFKIL